MPSKTLPHNSTAVTDPKAPGPDWQPLQQQLVAAVASTLSSPSALASDPDELRAAVDKAVVQGLELALQNAGERWLGEVLGAERYERSEGRTGSRSGTREHRFNFAAGQVVVKLGRPRRGPSRPEWVPVLKAAPERIKVLMRELWVRGLSSRDIGKMSEELSGFGRSHGTVATWVADVADQTLRWLNRPIDGDIRYLILDALYVPFVRDSSRKEALLVALGVDAQGHKQVLDVLHAPSESFDSWSTLLGKLKMRGLKVDKLDLVITDGDAGLISAVAAQLPKVKRQRCTVHKVRNVVGKSNRSQKKTAPAEAAAIFKAPSRAEARRRAQAFIDKYRETAPQLAAIIEDDLDACLQFYDHDANLWTALRSTNALERLNREFRRKLREVGAIKGEVNITRIAVQVARLVNEDAKGKPIAGFKEARS
jgi:putative transposase